MDEFVELQLSKQKAEREKYDREVLGISTRANTDSSSSSDVKSSVAEIISQTKQPSGDPDAPADDDSSNGEHKTGFKSADEALEHFGQAIAERTVEGQMKKYEEKKEEDAKIIRA